MARQNVARRFRAVATHQGELTAGRLVITFVSTTSVESGAMTPTRGRGRPRSEEHRDAVLKAAMELMQEDDLRRASVDRISARSGVSKATIYKWWPNRTAVAIDAFLHQIMVDAPVPDTGSAAEDFRLTLRGIMRFYTSPLGAIYAQLVGESQFYPTERERIRTHQVNLRRAAVTKIWHRGVARGELDSDVDPEVALDLIFGPAMYRMAIGHAGLTPADADSIVATAMRALVS
jgi:AcrR family transcriptional regulator